MPKGASAIGIEFDSQSIRAAKVRPGRASSTIVALEELSGSFSSEEEIINGLKALRQRMAISFADTLATCVGGKQTYAAQLLFKKLPDDEMKTALKFEIRKNLSFDTAGSTIEYQFLSASARKNELTPIIVTSVANALLQRSLRIFEKAGMPPHIIDVFPLVIANAFRAAGKQDQADNRGHVILHVGPDYSTVVIEGNDSTIPFYNRTIYFPAVEFFGPAHQTQAQPNESDRRINAFCTEISRSIAYYQSAFHTLTESSVTILGTCGTPELSEIIGRETGLAIERLDLVNELDANRTASPGRFDVAVALGMRGSE